MNPACAAVIGDILGWAATGPVPDPAGLEIIDGPSAIASALPVSDIAAASYGALALAAADLARLRNGRHLTPFADRRLAGLALAGNEYLTVDGTAPATWDPLTGYYLCGDGGYVYLHANFPHHRDGLLAVFETANDRESMTKALSGWRAAEAEEAAQHRGLCCIMLRDRATWLQHGQFAALSAVPPVAITASGLAQIAPLRPAPGLRPLSGLRVLDLSRVIAGPMAGRALGELGADVLRISAPDLPHIAPLVIDTGFNKRAAHADLRTDEGCAALRALIRDADVLIDGFRPGALDAKGFGTAALTALNPDLVVVTLSAFGDAGPWGGRRGYDSYVQAGIGLTAPDRPGDRPVRLACQPLDYLTGCLSAYGAVRALCARALGGGGAVVETSLARTGMWLWDMADRIGPEPSPPDRNPTRAEAEAAGYLRFMDTAFGHVGSLAPPYGFREQAADWRSPPHPLGSDPAEWWNLT